MTHDNWHLCCLIDGTHKLSQVCLKRFFWSQQKTTRQHCYSEAFSATGHWNWSFDQSNRGSIVSKDVGQYLQIFWKLRAYSFSPLLLQPQFYLGPAMLDLQWLVGLFDACTCNPIIIIKKQKKRLRIKNHRTLKWYICLLFPTNIACVLNEIEVSWHVWENMKDVW